LNAIIQRGHQPDIHTYTDSQNHADFYAVRFSRP
jgi:hypothetical protein